MLHAVHVQGFATKCATANHQLVVGFREVGHHFRSSHGIDGKAVDQRTRHLVGHDFKCTAGHGTASQGVLQNTQVHAFVAGLAAQLGHVSDRDATVFRHHERLSFSGEAGHFINDGLFLTAIETQGLLLKNVPSGFQLACACPNHLARSYSATNCFRFFSKPSAAGPPSALAVFRLSAWPVSFELAHQRSWMTCRSTNPGSPPH